MALWIGAHIVPNGDLAYVILLGSFSGFGALGGRLIDRRKKREMGPDWHRLRGAVATAPLFAPRVPLAMRVLAGLALYAALLWLHPYLFGVSPLP